MNVSLQLAPLVACARIAETEISLVEAIATAVSDAAKQRAMQRPMLARLLSLAYSGMPDAVLPFTADSLTINFAALQDPGYGCGDLVLYSRGSRLDLGYFRWNRDDLQYVDRDSMHFSDAAYKVIPDLAVPDDWLANLQKLQAVPPEASFSADAGDAIHIQMPSIEALRWHKSRTTLSILKFEKHQGVLRRTFGVLPAADHRVTSTGSEVVFRLSSEQQIELHAASFDDWWIHIDGGKNMEMLCPIPSLEAKHEPRRCRIALPWSEHPDLLGSSVPVSTPEPLAVELVKRFYWVAPMDPCDWLKMLQSD